MSVQVIETEFVTGIGVVSREKVSVVGVEGQEPLSKPDSSQLPAN